MNESQLDQIFGALSDATRRGMLAQLAQGEANISALAAPYNISQPAASKHLKVLERAGLIDRRREGRDHYIRVNPATVERAQNWISYYAQFWRQQFDEVDAYLQKHRGEKS